MFTPPETIIKSLRSVRYRYPSASTYPTLPSVCHPFSLKEFRVFSGSKAAGTPAAITMALRP
jgi:hypothetical protein